MSKATLTSKGQITIPVDVRRALGLETGDQLIFEHDESGVHVRPERRQSRFAKYQGVGNPGIPSGRAGIIRRSRSLRGE